MRVYENELKKNTGPLHIDPKIVGSPYNEDTNRVPLKNSKKGQQERPSEAPEEVPQ